MRQTISILFASLAISLSGYLSWRIWDPYLPGHWEIVWEQPEGVDSAVDWMKTLDITRDNTVHLNYSPFVPFPAAGEVSRLFREVRLGSSHMSFYIDHSLDGNTLHLEIQNDLNPSKPYQLTAVRSFKCIHWKPKY